jgi:outer membrane murein-binding lipoprotein Lpp
MTITRNSLAPLIALSILLAGCANVYYNARDALGTPRRDILVSRVSAAREDQREAQEQFQSALEEFSALVTFDGGDLEAIYSRLDKEYQRCESKADQVSDRIDSIESVSKSLFSEWEDELEEYTNQELRRSSEEKLDETRARCGELIAAMRRAEARMQPVLNTFHDHVLYLKHNLNAAAVASLEGEVGQLETDVAALIEEMNASIAEADAFLAAMDES